MASSKFFNPFKVSDLTVLYLGFPISSLGLLAVAVPQHVLAYHGKRGKLDIQRRPDKSCGDILVSCDKSAIFIRKFVAY